MTAKTKSRTVKKILADHAAWLADNAKGRRLVWVELTEKERANLGSADLRSADLRSANLGSADLGYANLRSADLGSADLRSADLRYANLGYADLRSANLGSADLGYANLRSANLGSADLGSADLGSADLGSADLRSADLRYANLRSADLRSADLGSADLGYADLRSANLRSANLRYAKHHKTRWPSAPALLLAAWGETAIAADLMRYDAANHPGGAAPFDAWAAGGPCPYSDCAFDRAAVFIEDKSKWKAGPAKSALELALALIAEKLEEVKDA